MRGSLPAPPTAAPSGSPSSGDFDPFASAFTETSVSWDDPGIATSSASSYRPVNEPSADLLDDWVSGLGLSTEAGRTNTPAPAPGAVTSPFTDINFGSDDDEGSDIFSSGPFDISTPIEPAAPPPAAALLTPEPPPAAKKGAQRLSPAVDDGLSSTAGKSSALASTDLIAEAFSGTFTPMKETDFRDSESSTGFDSIPAEIKATRIPGTDGERPFTLVAAVVLLAILNMGAAVMLMLRLLA